MWWFITLDRSANAQLIAMAAGGPKRIDDENAAITYNQIGNELAVVPGSANVRPIVKEQPTYSTDFAPDLERQNCGTRWPVRFPESCARRRSSLGKSPVQN